jgi:hypothetical protein
LLLITCSVGLNRDVYFCYNGSPVFSRQAGCTDEGVNGSLA